MKMKPLYDRLLVRVIEGDDRTSGGLIVPQIARENTPYLRAEVVAAGHGRMTPTGDTLPLLVQVGDVVCFFRAAGSGEQLIVPDGDGGELLCIREPHIVGVFMGLPRGTGLLAIDGSEHTVSPS